MTVKHTQACTEQQAKIQTLSAAYALLWPKHCKECDGWGGKVCNYDPSPAGVGLGSGFYTEFEPCEHCYEKGICPRCGNGFSQDLLEKETPCLRCDYHEGCEGMAHYEGCDCHEAAFTALREYFYDSVYDSLEKTWPADPPPVSPDIAPLQVIANLISQNIPPGVILNEIALILATEEIYPQFYDTLRHWPSGVTEKIYNAVHVIPS